MHRRRFLRVGSLVGASALAGCGLFDSEGSDASYSLSLDSVGSGDLADEDVTATYRSANLSNEQNGMLQSAIEDDYTELSPFSEGFRDLLERLGEDGELPSGSTSTYVEYDGEYYRSKVTLSMA